MDHRRCMARSKRKHVATVCVDKLAFEESNLLDVGNQLLAIVVCRVIPAQPNQRKGHSMRAFMQQPLLGMVRFRDIAIGHGRAQKCWEELQLKTGDERRGVREDEMGCW